MNASIWQQLGLLAPPTNEQEVQRAYAQQLNAPGSQSLEQLRSAYDQAIAWLREQGEIAAELPPETATLTPEQSEWRQAVIAERERLSDLDELEKSLLEDLQPLPWMAEGSYQPKTAHSPVMLKMLARLDRRLSYPIEAMIGDHIPEQIKQLRAYPVMDRPLAVSATSHEQGFGVSSNGTVRTRRRRSRGSYSQREKSVAGWVTAGFVGAFGLLLAALGGFFPSIDRTVPEEIVETEEPYVFGSDGRPKVPQNIGDQSALLRSIAELNQVSPSNQAAAIGNQRATEAGAARQNIRTDGILFGPVSNQGDGPR